jgi:outer membrane receptor protein involved in Fe transport
MKNKTCKIITSLVMSLSLIIAQKHSIHGIVRDEITNRPLPSVNILVNGTEIGTSTDDDGNFSIILNKDLPIELYISHIGYLEKVLTINNDRIIEVFLSPKVLEGQEVIIEGVQKHSKREVSSKIETIELKEIEKRGVRDISEILNEIDGVNISTTTYGKQTISIRGNNSNEIAVYMDGIKLNNSATGSADLAYVDLTDLEQIEVIKGGSSTLFGAGNFGGVVLLHSKKPQNNSIEYSRGFGATDENDQDLSIASTLKLGPIGAYGRYSGKSRLFDGRTLFTSIFGNYGGLLSFENQEIAYKHVDYNKYIEFPSGGIVSSDELMVDRITFFGNIFGTTGWDIQFGLKKWLWDDTFYTNINRYFTDDVEQYRINKGFKFNKLSGSVQVEKESQEYKGDHQINDSYSLKSWKSTGTLNQNDIGLATVLRYDIHNPVANIDLLRWEGGIRYGITKYEQNQITQEFNNQVEENYQEYLLEKSIPLSTYRLGVFAEGSTDKYRYQIFFSQGYNNRLPTLNDRFIWADGSNQLQQDYNRLLKAYYAAGGPKEIEDQLIKIQNIIDDMGDELEKEYISTTEVNSSIKLHNIDSSINKFEISAGLFRNSFINKIAYYRLENGLVVPYNTNSAWLNGAELSGEISLFDGLINIDGNITWVQPSDQEIFPNKPSTTGSIIVDINKKWFHINVSHIFNGPQYYIHGGVSVAQLEKQKNTNLTASIDLQLWQFDATISYSIRNIFSDEVTVITAGSQSGDLFNYYDAHRQIINFKLTLSDR